MSIEEYWSDDYEWKTEELGENPASLPFSPRPP
jgi:hypothetical protein